jgi:hypothetical protein
MPDNPQNINTCPKVNTGIVAGHSKNYPLNFFGKALYCICMTVVSIRPEGLTELRMALVNIPNLTLRKIEYAQGLCLQKGFKNSWTALLLYMMEVNQSMGLDRMRVNIAMALNMDSGKPSFAQKMYLQKVFKFSWMALLL